MSEVGQFESHDIESAKDVANLPVPRRAYFAKTMTAGVPSRRNSPVNAGTPSAPIL
jgi:hypothetical protein